MIQNLIHQEKDSLVQAIPWKGIPVVYGADPTFLTAGKSSPSVFPDLVLSPPGQKPITKPAPWPSKMRRAQQSRRQQLYVPNVSLHPSKEN